VVFVIEYKHFVTGDDSSMSQQLVLTLFKYAKHDIDNG